MNILSLIGRTSELFTEDIIAKHEQQLSETVQASRFLVIGGAGSIGQAIVKEIFKRNPKKLHVVDISQNNLVEFLRDIRNTFRQISYYFQTFSLDVGLDLYDTFWYADGQQDYVLNLSTPKHVHSEKDPYSLMRMIDINIFNKIKTLRQAISKRKKGFYESIQHYFNRLKQLNIA